jgi:hypothetical protein
MSALHHYCHARKLLWNIRWENTEGMSTHTLRVGNVIVGSVYKQKSGHVLQYVSNLLLPGVRARLNTYSYSPESEARVMTKARENVEESATAWFLKLEQ